MNPKAVKYFLITGVTVVWGLIIYRVIAGLSSGDPVPIVKSQNMVSGDVISQTDSFTLIADYPDPFIPGEDTAETEAVVITNATPPPPPPVIPAPPSDTYQEGAIQYLGIIANPQNKTKVAVITLQGKELMVKENDKVDDYTIRKIEERKMVILYKGKSITINRKIQ